ncbi:MAG TPA: hypothetical protein VN722_08410 [Hanamia sp.]|nr:hypothetical protein [Hanamia sp.]
METATLTSRVIKTELIEWRKLKFIQQETFKEFGSEAKNKLKTSILSNQFTQPFYVWQEPSTGDIFCLDGKHRTNILEILVQEGNYVPDLLPATFIDCANKKEAAELVLIYSSIYAKITQQGLFDFIEMYDISREEMKMTIDLPEFDMLDFDNMFKEGLNTFNPQSLTDKFVIPPFSIFDSRQGYWQDRKKIWHQLFNSQESREDIELIAKSGQSSAVYELRNNMRNSLGREPEWDEIIAEAKRRKMHIYEGASVFDPVLTEICYRWFCPEKGTILDPFAGGSVRGIVAGILGCPYYGIDLREDQVRANREQASKLSLSSTPTWLTGDSSKLLYEMEVFADFVFSCPPYHDLEQYSDDPADLSNMSYEKFIEVYEEIIIKSLGKLKDNRFACFVVGDIRDDKGFYRNFVSDTIKAFQRDSDCRLYNEIILINVAGSLPIRVGRQFENSRKVGKMHQNVLVFYKGDPKKIKEEFPEIKVEKYLQELNNQPNIAMSVID